MTTLSPVDSQRFRLILLKPSHYDDEGYVIRWWRAMIPSNSLAPSVLRHRNRALCEIAEMPARNGAVISGEILDRDEYNLRLDAQTGELKDLAKAGIVDPTKVVWTPLQSPVCSCPAR
jgi:hypothetical protein